MILIPLLWAVPAMILGGRAYTHEIIVKETLGRAVSTWVHAQPLWYYIFHLPLILFPWFILAAMAVVTLRRGTAPRRFCINWILAVLVPYSLMSSKLDIYMMALIPPLAILIADFCATGARGVRIANVAMLVIYTIIGAGGLIVSPAMSRAPEASLVARTDVRAFFATFAALATVGLLLATPPS